MAKRRGRSNRNSVKRNTPRITSRPPHTRLLHRPVKTPLLYIEDRRRSYMPTTLRPMSYHRTDASPVTPSPRVYRSSYTAPSMPRVLDTFPRDAVVCARRRIRKEVIFARGKGGLKGRKGRYHTNSESKIVCRKV